MKLKKIAIIVLTIFLSIGILPVNAEDVSDSPGNGYKYQLVSNNIFAPMRLLQEMKFRKVIKLDGYKGKNISGILNFELVPDKDTDLRYNDENNYTSVRILPGVNDYSYKIPFSSDDYVDDKYNELAWDIINYEKENKSPAFNDEMIKRELHSKFVDHALLHEWGRLGSSDDSLQIRVGKLLPEQFNNFGGNEKYNAQLDIIKRYADNGKKISWANDPDTKDVIGWVTDNKHDLDRATNRAYDFLGSDDIGSKNLLDYDSFCDGSMSVTDTFNLKAEENKSIIYELETITRPIALAKEYGKNGNIISITKPLMPSEISLKICKENSWDLINEIKAEHMEKDDYFDGLILRYRLKEKKPEGVNLEITNKDIIVDVLAGEDTILMFDNEEEADKYYKNTFYEEYNNIKNFAGLRGAKSNLKYAKNIDLVNKLGKVEVPKNEKKKEGTHKKDNKIENPKTGDNSYTAVYISVLIITVLILTLILIINKRRNNR